MNAFLLRSLISTRLGLRSLVRAKLRSSLTLLGVLFGVSSVIVMLAVGEGTRREALRQIEELGADNIILRSVRPSVETAVETEGGMFRYGLTPGDLKRLRAMVPGARLAPTREHQREVRRGDRVIQGRIVAVNEEYQDLNRIRLARGRFICDLDSERFAPVAVLAADTARVLFPIEDAIGRSVRIGNDQFYKVVGITERRSSSAGAGSNLPAQDFNRDVYIPFMTDSARFGQFLTYHRSGELEKDGLEISQVTLTVGDVQDVKAMAEAVGGLINEFHSQEDVVITVPLDLLEQVEETQRLFKLVLGAIASISLLVGGIGIMNIMLATVSERTREVGIRRALGAKRRDIVRQFLLETVLLSGSGGLLGIGVGLAASYALAVFLSMSTIVLPSTLLVAFGISLAVGLVFGTYPASRAARMNPVEALRHE